MTEKKRNFVLYEYLLYFWKKKIYFLIVPLITMAVSIGAYYLINDAARYTGKVEVYTGSVKAHSLTNPANIKAGIQNNKLQVYVPQKGHVRFTLSGDNKSEISNNLNMVTDEYEKMLIKNYKDRFQISEDYLKTLDRRVLALESNIKSYKKQLDEKDYPIDQYGDLTNLITETESTLTESLERSNNIKSDLVFFEKPQILSREINESKSYLKESAISGLLLGFILTVGLLVLLKYIGDARRYYKHD